MVSTLKSNALVRAVPEVILLTAFVKIWRDEYDSASSQMLCFGMSAFLDYVTRTPF